jgi:hypothetical protein
MCSSSFGVILEKMSFMVRGTIPGSFSVPMMVCDLPALVMP